MCEHCKKDIPEDELDIEQIMTRPSGRGHSAKYRPGYYHKKCLAQLRKEREEKAKAKRLADTSKAKKWSFAWGIIGGVITLVASLLIMLAIPSVSEVIKPWLAVLLSIVFSYGIFAMLYCIISGSYIGEVFLWCSSLSIKFPGLIFSWDLGGLAWLIAMKILFAILGFLVGVFALIFAIVFSATLGMVSFPFVLIHNEHNDYEDSPII